ncbi:cytochrome P450 71A1-like [Zingiber officinale]|uniref:cytochrome P450 71A1-like n=1 Tax=Zingiber officinale TaxID=94328 RepID=UPI001C4CF20C|nr:cytochrome P450 71A1-like [Zingiber officinale]
MIYLPRDDSGQSTAGTLRARVSPFVIVGAKRKSISSYDDLPPSPPRLPLVGNLHQLGPFIHKSLAALSSRHGPLSHLRLGRVPTLVVSSPDAARDVLRTHDHICASRSSTTVTRILLDGCSDMAFAPYGDEWRQRRRICTLHLLSPKMVQSYALIREQEVAAMISAICSRGSAAEIDMSAVLFAFSNDILCRIVTGKKFEGRKGLFSKLISENSVLLAKIYLGDYLPWLGWVDWLLGNVARVKKNHKRWDDLLDQVIKEHEERVSSDDEKDFVDVLISLQKDPVLESILTPEVIKALLQDMFAAGTETSYITLEWAMAELVRNPSKMQKLQDQVRSVAGGGGKMVKEEELCQMPYLKAVIKETFRLHPPIPLLLPRELLDDCPVQGYNIQKKTRLFVNAWAMGRDPKCWEAPFEFQPERFMDGEVDFTGNDLRFIPFGAGRRICPGLNFAVASLELALANLVHRYDWELPVGLSREEFGMEEVAGLMVQREGRLNVVAKTWDG